MLLVSGFAEQFAGYAIRLASIFADVTIEFYIGDIKLRMAGRNVFVDHVDELDAFLAVELAAVLVHALEIRLHLRGRFVVAALETPNVEPMRGTGAIYSEEIQADRQPL